MIRLTDLICNLAQMTYNNNICLKVRMNFCHYRMHTTLLRNVPDSPSTTNYLTHMYMMFAKNIPG